LYEVGNVVRVIDDMAEVFRLQKGHGEWTDNMALVCKVLVKSFFSHVRIAHSKFDVEISNCKIFIVFIFVC